jgi:hypothetical protein
MTAPDIRLQHLARRLHLLGPRVLAELLAEHIAHRGDLLERVERYAAIDPAALELTGGDRFPPTLAAIDGGGE